MDLQSLIVGHPCDDGEQVQFRAVRVSSVAHRPFAAGVFDQAPLQGLGGGPEEMGAFVKRLFVARAESYPGLVDGAVACSGCPAFSRLNTSEAKRRSSA